MINKVVCEAIASGGVHYGSADDSLKGVFEGIKVITPAFVSNENVTYEDLSNENFKLHIIRDGARDKRMFIHLLVFKGNHSVYEEYFFTMKDTGAEVVLEDDSIIFEVKDDVAIVLELRHGTLTYHDFGDYLINLPADKEFGYTLEVTNPKYDLEIGGNTYHFAGEVNAGSCVCYDNESATFVIDGFRYRVYHNNPVKDGTKVNYFVGISLEENFK